MGLDSPAVSTALHGTEGKQDCYFSIVVNEHGRINNNKCADIIFNNLQLINL